MPASIEQLQKENDRLEQLAYYDELTGIFNRRAAEQNIVERMTAGAALLVCDLDYFKKINDTYGHLTGDVCLKDTAEMLSYIMRKGDVVGRIGGDEFVVFASGKQTEETVSIIEGKINSRFQSYNSKAKVPLYMSIGHAFVRDGDTYESLFARADEDLFAQKRIRHSVGEGGSDDWDRDIDQIKGDLVEILTEDHGSYCQDYETFKKIYRFIERSLRRSNNKACIVLFSLTRQDGKSFSPVDKFMKMDILSRLLEKHLRLGDVYTRYSSGQYLVLLMDADQHEAEIVSQRIRQLFLESSGEQSDVLLHYCHELEAVKIEE